MIEDVRLRLSPKDGADYELLARRASEELGLDRKDVHDVAVVRKSIDARQRRVMLNLTLRVAFGDDKSVDRNIREVELKTVGEDAPTVVVVGAGPAGLFAALKLLEYGIRPIVLERGKDVDRRAVDLAKISREGILNPDSNYCFGEGGAGAFSDGKLFTRSKKRGNVDDVLQLLVQFGAKREILRDAHAHIGSDKLPRVIKNIREAIRRHGGEVLFDSRVTELLLHEGHAVGVRTETGEEYLGEVILATGHSARDIYRMLQRQGVALQAKGIAIGVRLEHPQELIDRIQYHSKEGRGKYLPAAEYSFVTQADGRGVYSFCMCPGGVIVPAGSAPGESVVNGMSASARAGKWANSGMVVQINPGDFPQYAEYGELEIMALQEALEKEFFEAAEQTYRAPAQRMLDFVERRVSESLPASSYPAGLISRPMHKLLPPFIADRLRKGFLEFGRKSKGFLTNDACVIGLESRTSSPVRIPRDKERFEHIEIQGLYPAGEGAGYAGGIVSAAIDGQRCAEQIIAKRENRIEND